MKTLMKTKLLILTLCTLALASCGNDPDKEYCFEVKVTVTYRDTYEIHSKSEGYFMWCTEAQMEAEKEYLKEQKIESGVPEEFITVTGERVHNKSKAACNVYQLSAGIDKEGQ